MSISEIIKQIDILIAPVKVSESETVEQTLFKKLNESFANEVFDDLQFLENSFSQQSPFHDEPWWPFLCTLMQKLLELKNALRSNADENECILSVPQVQSIKSSLQILVSLGISAHLFPGIGITLEQRSPLSKKILPSINTLQKCYCLNLVLRLMMCLRENNTLKNLLASTYVGDCLAAIFQLLLNPESYINDPSNKSYLETQLSHLLEETSPPVLMRELMLLNGNKGCPPKLTRALRLIMIERLQKENGVVAICRAILDFAGDETSPKQWATLSTIAKLISTPHRNKEGEYRDKVYPQIRKLLSTNEIQYSKIAVLCVKTIYEAEPDICEKYFINEICKALIQPSTEDELNNSLESLYNCIGIPSIHHWALPPSLFKKIHVPVFRLYCFVINGVSHIKKKLKNIVMSILSQDMDYNGFIFGSVNLKFNYAEHGGIYTELSKEEEITPWGDATDILLDLMEDDDMKVKLFEAAISSLEGSLEKRLIGARVLSELSTVPAVLKWIDDEPSGIVNFVRTLLESDHENDITCLGLMVLSLILNNGCNMKDKDWNLFNTLVEPLKKFKNKSDNVELRVLADDLYCTILTRGVIKKKAKDDKLSSTFNKPKVGQLAQALSDVSDPILPVRAHGLRDLSKLILARDPEAEKNKENIFSIFKDNLKCDDSYVYLSAVEGMASLVGMYPDEVLVGLTEQFVHCQVTESRLKVGEVLMRAIRVLGEMASVYKNEIINALLYGCQDQDHIIRASSLSSLGELCSILSFRIHAFLLEIFNCIKIIFETDKAMEPRRAAVMLLTLLLKGLGADALNVLEPVLVNIYRLLKYIYNCDKDDITKLHAQLAIEELNARTIMFLNPPLNLKKDIFVLHPPT